MQSYLSYSKIRMCATIYCQYHTPMPLFYSFVVCLYMNKLLGWHFLQSLASSHGHTVISMVLFFHKVNDRLCFTVLFSRGDAPIMAHLWEEMTSDPRGYSSFFLTCFITANFMLCREVSVVQQKWTLFCKKLLRSYRGEQNHWVLKWF